MKHIGEIIKENRKKFRARVWRNYGNGDLLTQPRQDWDDLMPQFFWDNYDNKHFARQLKIIYLAVDEVIRICSSTRGWYDYVTNRSEIAEICERLHKRYWKGFEKRFAHNVKNKYGGVWPTMNRTQALKEFLAMGYVYKTDINFNPKDHYCVYAHIGGLWWPETFESHQDAIAVQMKYGIPGLTGTTLPKDKN